MAGDARDIPDAGRTEESRHATIVRMRQEVQRLMGMTGTGMDMAVTWRQLNDQGLVNLRDNGARGSGRPGDISIPGDIIVGGVDPTPDLTPPPDVVGLSAVAAITNVIASWTAHVPYTQGHGHKQVNIYAVKRNPGDPNPVFGDASRVYEATSELTLAAIPSDPNIRWHLWAKNETVDGVESINPVGGTNGVIVTTGQDVTHLLQVLTGQITEGQLYAALVSRINLIDGPDTLAGSVAQRVLAEATARGAAISSEATTRATNDTAIAATVTSLAATVSTNYTTLTSAITSESTTRASADAAMATDITTLYASVGTNSAAISTEATARAALDGSVHALYTVRAQVTSGGRTVVGGFGLAATSTTAGGAEIEFGVRADRFYIGAPTSATGVGDVLPFVVQTSDEVVNGVTIPKGVYMDAAYIKNLTAMTARLGAAWIDNAMIADLSAAKITAGNIQAGYIRSTTYTAGSAGWSINADGSAEFNNVTVRGTIVATAGSVGGITIASGNISGNYTADTAGFKITGSSGAAEFNDIKVRGTLDIKSATSGARTEITTDKYRVYDSGGVLRVKLGNLA